MADALMTIIENAPVSNKPKSKAGPSNTVQVTGDPADGPRLIAQIAVTPSLQAALTIKRWAHAVADLDISALIDELRQQAATASSGDLKRQEAMLAIQAHTLDTIFNELARRSQANMGQGHYLEDTADRYMRLALKAQSQCRATIETLAVIKNPKPVAFVQQANIANGPQQVNNVPAEPSRAGNSQIQQSKLLEQQPNERLDGGTARAAASGNTSVEAVGAVHRTEDG